jgi:hypothetical protein
MKFYEVTLDGAPINDAILDAVAQVLVTELPASITSNVQVGFWSPAFPLSFAALRAAGPWASDLGAAFRHLAASPLS